MIPKDYIQTEVLPTYRNFGEGGNYNRVVETSLKLNYQRMLPDEMTFDDKKTLDKIKEETHNQLVNLLYGDIRQRLNVLRCVLRKENIASPELSDIIDDIDELKWEI